MKRTAGPKAFPMLPALPHGVRISIEMGDSAVEAKAAEGDGRVAIEWVVCDGADPISGNHCSQRPTRDTAAIPPRPPERSTHAFFWRLELVEYSDLSARTFCRTDVIMERLSDPYDPKSLSLLITASIHKSIHRKVRMLAW